MNLDQPVTFGRDNLPMQYVAPTTSKEAASLLANAKGKAAVLAGGTDLLVRMKSGDFEPALIVDIKRIEATQKIAKLANGFKIGLVCPARFWAETPR